MSACDGRDRKATVRDIDGKLNHFEDVKALRIGVLVEGVEILANGAAVQHGILWDESKMRAKVFYTQSCDVATWTVSVNACKQGL